jgi:nucleotide-binding universal stress UspA family protein
MHTEPPTARVRIIAPVTFADDSLEAAAVAADLAAALCAELVLAGIAPVVPLEPSFATPTELEALQQQAEHQRVLDHIVSERLEELAEALPDGIRCRTLLTWGPVGPALVEVAREQDADLVIVPIRRESGLGHLLHDGADRYVLHHSDVPVIVVPTNGRTASVN